MFSPIIDKVAEKTPVAVMNRAVLENVLSAEKIDAIFHETKEIQRESPWLFSLVVSFMSMVVCRVRRSIGDAYTQFRHFAPDLKNCLYKKINNIELVVSEALVRETARDIKQIIVIRQHANLPFTATS